MGVDYKNQVILEMWQMSLKGSVHFPLNEKHENSCIYIPDNAVLLFVASYKVINAHLYIYEK